MSFKKCNFFLILLVTVFCQTIICQNSSFIESKQGEPLIKRGHRVHKMNRYSKHIVMYVTHTTRQDSLCHVITDSLKYINDTLLVRVCGRKTWGCTDTLIPKNESWSYINNSYWQKIPINRLYKIKSKLQPIAGTSSTIVVLSYVAFVSGIVIGVSSKNLDTQALGANMFIIGDALLISSLVTNIAFAKKRFKFNKIKVTKKYTVNF